MTTGLNIAITESEWEVMRVVWANKEVTSKEISEVLEKKKEWKPATTKTFIGRLVKKEMLNTEKEGNKYLYTTDINEIDFIKSILGGLFSNVCNREKGEIIAHLLSQIDVSFGDIDKIDAILEQKRTEAVDLVPCNCIPGQCHCQISA